MAYLYFYTFFIFLFIHRMCSLTIECVLLLWNVFSYYSLSLLSISIVFQADVFSYYGMCSLTIECVLLL